MSSDGDGGRAEGVTWRDAATKAGVVVGAGLVLSLGLTVANAAIESYGLVPALLVMFVVTVVILYLPERFLEGDSNA